MVTVNQKVFDQIRDMSRTAVRLPGSFNVGDRITFNTNDEPSGIDRYVSCVEPLTLEYQLVHFAWPLAPAVKALLVLMDTAESIDDGVKMLQITAMLKAHLK